MFASAGYLDELEMAVDRLNAADLSAQSPVQTRELMLDLERVKAKLAGFEAKVCRKFEVDREWATVGAQTPAAYLSTRLRAPSKAYKRQFSLGRRMAALPAVVEALAAGEISTSHRDKILAIDNPRVHDALVDEQDILVGWAKRLRWKNFEAELALWLEEHDQDGPAPTDLLENSFDWSQTFAGRWRFDGNGDPIGGGIVTAELKRLEQLEFEADWAEAKERLGREPLAHELARTPKQRRWAAFLRMARRSATGPEEGRHGAILLTVFVGIDAMRRTMEADNGTVLRPGQVSEWLDDATFETIIFDTEFRTITASKQRNYRGAIRRAVLGRDRECSHEYCDMSAADCQTDHHQPASKGGPTDVWNGKGRCPFHNRAKGNKDPTELGEGP